MSILIEGRTEVDVVQVIVVNKKMRYFNTVSMVCSTDVEAMIYREFEGKITQVSRKLFMAPFRSTASKFKSAHKWADKMLETIIEGGEVL